MNTATQNKNELSSLRLDPSVKFEPSSFEKSCDKSNKKLGNGGFIEKEHNCSVAQQKRNEIACSHHIQRINAAMKVKKELSYLQVDPSVTFAPSSFEKSCDKSGKLRNGAFVKKVPNVGEAVKPLKRNKIACFDHTQRIKAAIKVKKELSYLQVNPCVTFVPSSFEKSSDKSEKLRNGELNAPTRDVCNEGE